MKEINTVEMLDELQRTAYLELQIKRVNYCSKLYEEKLKELMGEEDFYQFCLECVIKLNNWDHEQNVQEDG